MNIERIKETVHAGIELVKEVIHEPMKYVASASTEVKAQRSAECEVCPIRTGNQCDPTKTARDIHGQIVRGCGCYLPAAISRNNKECPRKVWRKDEIRE